VKNKAYIKSNDAMHAKNLGRGGLRNRRKKKTETRATADMGKFMSSREGMLVLRRQMTELHTKQPEDKNSVQQYVACGSHHLHVVRSTMAPPMNGPAAVVTLNVLRRMLCDLAVVEMRGSQSAQGIEETAILQRNYVCNNNCGKGLDSAGSDSLDDCFDLARSESSSAMYDLCQLSGWA
jgi:hypothetical protein